MSDTRIVVLDRGSLIARFRPPAFPHVWVEYATTATGTNNVDLEACRARGVAVTHVRHYAGATVAEHVFSCVLALRRALLDYRDRVRAGQWARSEQFRLLGAPISELAGTTLAILGRGDTGRAVARVAEGFGMRVVWAERKGVDRPRPGYVAFDEALACADVVTLHCPLSPDTRGLVGSRELSRMKSSALLVNAARGGLVDEKALAEALAAA